MTSAKRGPGRYPIVIIGAGMSGIAAAVRLLREGVDDFVVLEKSDGLAARGG